MPVFPQTYRNYEGHWRPRALSWWVITSKGLWRAWKSWATFTVLIFGAMIFLSFFARIYMAANAELVSWLGLNPSVVEDVLSLNERFYYQYLMTQSFIVFLFTILIGGDLIALDRRTKALTLYLSKPITRFDYVFGKASILLIYLFALTAGGSFLLMLSVAVMTDDPAYLVREAALVFRITAFSGLLVVPHTLLILMLSSLMKTRISATVFFCLIYWLPNMIIMLFLELTDRMWMAEDPVEWWSLFSLQNLWTQMGQALFNQETQFNLHWGFHLVALIVISILSGMILFRQIRAVEVVN